MKRSVAYFGMRAGSIVPPGTASARALRICGNPVIDVAQAPAPAAAARRNLRRLGASPKRECFITSSPPPKQIQSKRDNPLLQRNRSAPASPTTAGKLATYGVFHALLRVLCRINHLATLRDGRHSGRSAIADRSSFYRSYLSCFATSPISSQEKGFCRTGAVANSAGVSFLLWPVRKTKGRRSRRRTPATPKLWRPSMLTSDRAAAK